MAVAGAGAGVEGEGGAEGGAEAGEGVELKVGEHAHTLRVL